MNGEGAGARRRGAHQWPRACADQARAISLTHPRDDACDRGRPVHELVAEGTPCIDAAGAAPGNGGDLAPGDHPDLEAEGWCGVVGGGGPSPGSGGRGRGRGGGVRGEV
jgi:hypothetical protein